LDYLFSSEIKTGKPVKSDTYSNYLVKIAKNEILQIRVFKAKLRLFCLKDQKLWTNFVNIYKFLALECLKDLQSVSVIA